jgi:hypothetical protein
MPSFAAPSQRSGYLSVRQQFPLSESSKKLVLWASFLALKLYRLDGFGIVRVSAIPVVLPVRRPGRGWLRATHMPVAMIHAEIHACYKCASLRTSMFGTTTWSQGDCR